MSANSAPKPRRTARRATDEHAHEGRARAPALIAVAVEIVLYATLPSALIVGPRLAVPILATLLLVPLALASTRKDTKRSRGWRIVAIVLVILIGAVNTVALILLIHKIVTGEIQQAGSLLLAALQIWLTNMITFALIFWEIDRGGPLLRARAARSQLEPADFRFTQDEDGDVVVEVASGSSEKSDWRPAFIDYLYLSCSNSTAFSPTDTMPLTTRAKVLMAIQSIEALLLSLLVVAQAVSLIKQ